MNNNKLFELGYIKNRKTYIDELQKLLPEQKIRIDDINKMVDSGIASFDKYGRDVSLNGGDVQYKTFKTGYKDSSNEEIIGWLSKENNNSKGKEGFVGKLSWGTPTEFAHEIRKNAYFRIGKLAFSNATEGVSFLEDIADATIPETWDYKRKESKIKYPILKSYIENVLIRLEKEQKIIFSENRKKIMFNTNLLDRYFNDIIVIADAKDEDLYSNPRRITGGKEELIKEGFSKENKADIPCFFEDIKEVVFQTDWEVDTDNYNKLTHIIEERKERFPKKYQSGSESELAEMLKRSIKYAVAMAQRNYKFIVPMYRPQKDKIQLLMPIYLTGSFQETPDFSLVLTPDEEHNLYLLETILPLEAAYQNARLIAKPDETWLNPDKIGIMP